MAENETIEIHWNGKAFETEVASVAAALEGLNGVLASTGAGIRDAFSVKGLKNYQKTASRFGKDLANELLQLQLSFGAMKYAIAEAVAPIASVFVPMINTAIQAVIRFADVTGQFLRGIFAAVTGNKTLAEASHEASQSQETLGKTVEKTGKAVRRSLAGFDQLQRLNGPTGSGGSAGGEVEQPEEFVPEGISEKVQAVVDRVMAILAPLLAIDLTPLQTAFQNLGQSFMLSFSQAGESLNFFWQELLTPFIAWVLEDLAPAFMETFAMALKTLRIALDPVIEGVGILWQALQPLVEFIGQAVVTALENWRQRFVELSWVFYEKKPVILGIFQNLAQAVTQAWQVISPILSTLQSHFSTVFASVSGTVGTTIGYMLDMLYGITQFLSGVFSGSWETAWEGVKLFLKSAVNGIIGLLNTMITRLAGALNAVVKTANKLSFTVPEWVPVFGGNRFGVNLPTVTAPQIPYLAKGAVLPAGKPFLAMVGDQRHGTNIEAPLSTIQEAVALVMEDQTDAILRGFEASVQVQRDILQAVLGIHIGDEVIGQAVSRYQRKLAVVRGG